MPPNASVAPSYAILSQTPSFYRCFLPSNSLFALERKYVTTGCECEQSGRPSGQQVILPPWEWEDVTFRARWMKHGDRADAVYPSGPKDTTECCARGPTDPDAPGNPSRRSPTPPPFRSLHSCTQRRTPSPSRALPGPSPPFDHRLVVALWRRSKVSLKTCGIVIDTPRFGKRLPKGGDDSLV